MKRYFTVLILSLLALFSLAAFAAKVGESAPDFTATAHDGNDLTIEASEGAVSAAPSEVVWSVVDSRLALAVPTPSRNRPVTAARRLNGDATRA